ncbi:MAG: CoA transferase, partial [Betaproteobacteria bacterium]|nr:CoA transferase [Betaproteobacteria bacterium]
MKTRAMTLPYSSLRVLDITRVLASPYATYLLALLGADVVKVEDPTCGGDASRKRVGDDPRLASVGMACNFISLNSNKRSVTVNLRTPEGQQQLRRLATDADVLVENLRAGAMQRYGLGYDDLRALNPRLVYCSITGYGSTGAKAAHPAYDPVIQAATGMMAITGTAVTGPLKSGAPVVDYAAGLAGAF